MLPQNLTLFYHLLWLKESKFIQRRFLRAVRIARPSKKSTVANEDISSESILDTNSDYNYLGINEKQDNEIIRGSYVYEKNEHLKQIKEKYVPLFQTNKKYQTINRKYIGLLNVRLDSENKPTFHGEFEKRDELVFKTLDDVVKHINSYKIDTKQPTSNEQFESSKSSHDDDDIIIDEVIEKKPSNSVQASLINQKIQFRYSGQLITNQKSEKKKEEEQEDWITYEQSKREPKSKPKPELNLSDKIASVQFEPLEKQENNQPEIISGFEYLKQICKGQRKAHFQEEFDALKNLIPKEKLDTKGYRILSSQVPDFSKMSNQEVLEMLKKQILFNDEDIVAINKPYGLAIHGAFGQTERSVKTSTSRVNSQFNYIIHLVYFLPKLAEHLQCSRLYTVHRLDRDTTGILLLAKTQEKAQQLNELFKEQKIQKQYLCITKNKPDLAEGIINIPIELGYIKSPDGKKRERMVLCPHVLEDVRLQRAWRTAKPAITHYKIKSDHGNAALLQVTPETGVRHQIRVHLGFGLRCPILGDHKYSNLNSLAPQKLPSDLLMALRIRQAKTRNVPMHLHSYLMMIPQLGKHGRNIFIRAPLPSHFKENMRSLKLTLN